MKIVLGRLRCLVQFIPITTTDLCYKLVMQGLVSHQQKQKNNPASNQISLMNLNVAI